MKTIKRIVSAIFRYLWSEKSTVAAFSSIESAIAKFISNNLSEKEITEHLNYIIAHHKSDKFDVYDMIQTVKRLQASIPQEKLAYISVLTTSADHGVDKDDIIRSIVYYGGIISSYKESFKSTADAMIERSISATKAEIDKYNKQKESNKKTIENLLRQNKEIEDTIVHVDKRNKKYLNEMLIVKGIAARVSDVSIAVLKSEKDKCSKYLG